MSDVLTGRLLVAATVWAGLVTLRSPGAVTAASLAGTLVASVALMALLKLVFVKSKGVVSERRSSSDA